MSCCDDPTSAPGIPAVPPPCTEESCSVGFRPLNETGGALSPFVKVVGGLTTALVRKLTTGDTARPGLLRHFHDADGECLGLGLDLAGRPAAMTVDCVNYVNPVREISNGDGTFSLGGLPLPLQGSNCVASDGACTGQFPPGVAGELFGDTASGGCGPSVEVAVENTGCWPLMVTPTVTIVDAALGSGPVTMMLETDTNGAGPGSPVQVFSSRAGSFTTDPAGAATTTPGGAFGDHTHDISDHADTSSAGAHNHAIGQRNTEDAAGPDNHNHRVPGTNTQNEGAHTHTLADHTLGAAGAQPDHTHDIGDHTHTFTAEGRATYSGSIRQPSVVVQPGETFTFAASSFMRYDANVEAGAELNFGRMTVCLDYASQITPETVAAITG